MRGDSRYGILLSGCSREMHSVTRHGEGWVVGVGVRNGTGDSRALEERLQRALGADAVLTGEACAPYAIQRCVPAVVARPLDADGVSAALAVAAEVGATVVPWGGGSRAALGYPPRRCDLVLSMERLTGVLSYDPEDLTISVRTGMSHTHLAAVLADAHQMLPLDVPLVSRATLGGTLATATLGLRRAFYGGPRDLTLGLRVADARGTLLKTGGKVVKNVTGYDMTKLFLGSLGTLGVIVEANLKLVPVPDAEVTLLGIFSRAAPAFESADLLDALAVRPSAAAAVQVRAIPDLAALAPGHVESVLLAARFPGSTGAVKRAASEGEAALRQAGARNVLVLDHETQPAFWAELHDFAQTAARGPREALLRVAALPMECPAVTETAQAMASEHDMALAWLADTLTGTVWLRLRGQESPDATSRESVEASGAFGAALRAVQDALVHRWRSSVVLDCSPALKPHLPVWGADPSALDLMREVKRSFDPDYRLNPGRFIAEA